MKKINFSTHVMEVFSEMDTTYDEVYKKFEYKIVGSSESNPKEGKISDESPIGAAMIDHKKGEIIDVETPSGVKKFKIVSISK